MKNDSITKSIPASQTVRGYEIKRMPIGQFLAASQRLQDMPETVLKLLFPDSDSDDMMTIFSRLNKAGLQALFVRALTVLPGQAVALFSQLSGLSEKSLAGKAIG